MLLLLASSLPIVVLVVGCGSGPKEVPPSRAESINSGTAAPKPIVEPKKVELNQKEALIQKGLKTGKNAYPTLEDVNSDWSDGEKNGRDPKKKKKGPKEKKDDKESNKKADSTTETFKKKEEGGGEKKSSKEDTKKSSSKEEAKKESTNSKM